MWSVGPDGFAPSLNIRRRFTVLNGSEQLTLVYSSGRKLSAGFRSASTVFNVGGEKKFFVHSALLPFYCLSFGFEFPLFLFVFFFFFFLCNFYYAFLFFKLLLISCQMIYFCHFAIYYVYFFIFFFFYQFCYSLFTLFYKNDVLSRNSKNISINLS